MPLGKRWSKGVIALACAAALSGVRIAAAQSAGPAPEAPPAPQPAQPEAGDLFAEGADPAPEQPRQREGPTAGNRRNMVWDRVAQQRFEAERRRLEAEMRRLQVERQRLEAELRRAEESMRRAERDANRFQPGFPGNPGPQTGVMPPTPMPPGFGPGPRGPAPMGANPYAQPPGQAQPPGSDRERELMRAHGFSAERGAPGSARGPFLGVAVSAAPGSLRRNLQLPEGIGLVVNSVESGSPAQKAGLKQNDVLHKIDDQLLVNVEQMTVLIRTFKPGQEVRLGIVRGGKPMKLTARLSERNLAPLSVRPPMPGMPPMQGMPPMPGMPPMQGMAPMPGMPPTGPAPAAPGFPVFPGPPQGLAPPAPQPPGAPMRLYRPVPAQPPGNPGAPGFLAPAPVGAAMPMPAVNVVPPRVRVHVAPVAPMVPVGPIAPAAAPAPPAPVQP